MEKNVEKFAILLKSLRAKNNLTQKYLAYRLGISQSQYNKLENGETPVTIDRLMIIAEVFNIEKREFLRMVVEGNADREPGNEKPVMAQVLQDDEPGIEFYKNLSQYLEKRFLKLYKKYVMVRGPDTGSMVPEE